jgi:holo-[acyl-carrier protein] synthase
MEIVGIGTDIVECLRIGRMIEQHGELFLTRVYTEREILYCQGRKRALEHFAARWAAKEAIRKCLGAGWRALTLTDLEVRLADGRPQVHLAGAARDLAQRLHIGTILLSLGHCRAYATAYALALRVPAS